MQYTRESAIERLLKNYGPYYNIHMIEDDQTPITARCDFFEHSGQYVISKKQNYGLRKMRNFSIC